MKRLRKLCFGSVTCALLTALICSPRARAESREVVQLQTQVQMLSDLLERLQSTLDARFGVLQNLMQQTTSSTDQTVQSIAAIEQDVDVQSSNLRGKLDISAGQIQSLNDSVKELKSHVDRLAKSIESLQSQLQIVENTRQVLPVSGTTAPGTPLANSGPGLAPSPEDNPAPPLQATYQAALGDYYAARYGLAKGEFQDVTRYYSENNLAGNAQFYLGEIAYTARNFSEAIKDYEIVIQQYSGNPKEPTAELHRGYALLRLNRRKAGIEQLRSLLQRYPQAPEASDARRKLRSMGLPASTFQP